MNKTFRNLIVVFFLAVLSACEPQKSISETESTWKMKIEEFHLIGKTKKDLLIWLRREDVPITSLPKETVILEEIDGDGLVCIKWHILLSFSFNASETIESYTVSSAGTCL